MHSLLLEKHKALRLVLPLQELGDQLYIKISEFSGEGINTVVKAAEGSRYGKPKTNRRIEIPPGRWGLCSRPPS